MQISQTEIRELLVPIILVQVYMHHVINQKDLFSNKL